jgi:hypothetical protein
MLLDYLATIPDYRRAEGRRFRLDHLLTMVILGLMSGRNGYRELCTFIKGNAQEFREIFGYSPSKAMPSHVTIRHVLQHVDYNLLITAFHQWMRSLEEPKTEKETIGVSIDGKALRSTVSSYDNSEQNFVQTVHAFAHERQVALGVSVFEQKKSHEVASVQSLIEALELQHVIFTLDALHLKKKQS